MPDATLHVTEVVTTPSGPLPVVFGEAFQDALAGRGAMDEQVYKVEGFCGRKFRLFLNNLIRSLGDDARYLEVGVFKGATLCAAVSGNAVNATAIDNWSWDKDQGVASTFYNNLAKFKSNKNRVSIIEANFRSVSPSLLGAFNVYFYDGSHAEKDQYDGIIWAMPSLDDQSVVLVDDWNWAHVRAGTMNALRDAGATIDYMVELRTSFDDKIPTPAHGGSDWHNGFFGAVISKSPVAVRKIA